MVREVARDYRVQFKEYDPQSNESIRGLLDQENRRPAATTARERLHYLAFVCEEDFSDEEIRQRTRFFRNDHLVPESCLASYPLARTHPTDRENH
jgi:hypothetical protein